MISLIVATSSNNVIGYNGGIPWHLPDDLRRFKAITKGHHVIMGRKTFESIGSKPLPNRINIVVSANNHKHIKSSEPIITVNSLENALLKSSPDSEVFIIGGANIYNSALQFVDKIYLTKIFKEFIGDTYFPKIDENVWSMTEYLGNFKDATSELDYAYITYRKSF